MSGAWQGADPAASRQQLFGWLLIGGVMLAALSRHLLIVNSSGSATFQSTAHASAFTCPLTYRRLDLDEIRAGQMPYVLGGQQQPTCKNCKPGNAWSEWCRFERNGTYPITCSAAQKRHLVDTWLGRGHELALRLTPCDLWPLIRGRTLFFMGDSMSGDFYHAALCFFVQFWPSLLERNASADPRLQARLSVTTRPQDASATCVDLLEGTSICRLRVDNGHNMTSGVLPALLSISKPSDLLVLNFGLHHNSREDYKQALLTLADHYQAHRALLPRTLWQQTAQQHFATADGEYRLEVGGPPFTCQAVDNLSVQGDGVLQQEPGTSDPFNFMRGGSWRNQMADPIIGGAGIRILPSYNESVWMAGFHRDNGEGNECTHYCHPSAPQSWLVALYKTLSEQSDGR